MFQRLIRLTLAGATVISGPMYADVARALDIAPPIPCSPLLEDNWSQIPDDIVHELEGYRNSGLELSDVALCGEYSIVLSFYPHIETDLESRRVVLRCSKYITDAFQCRATEHARLKVAGLDTAFAPELRPEEVLEVATRILELGRQESPYSGILNRLRQCEITLPIRSVGTVWPDSSADYRAYIVDSSDKGHIIYLERISCGLAVCAIGLSDPAC